MTGHQVHLITGAGSGIGAAVATALHERGDELVLLARSQPRAHELQQQYDGARVVVADLAVPEHLEHALADANLPPRLDSVLHIAGVVDLIPVVAGTPVHRVRARAAVEDIVARPALQPVVARIARQIVGTITAQQGIVAGKAQQRVAVRATRQPVIRNCPGQPSHGGRPRVSTPPGWTRRLKMP